MVKEVEEKPQIRIILVEDYALNRAGMRALINDLSNITIVAEAHDGPEAIDLICQHQPDLVLMDIGLPTVDGHQVTTTISKQFPQIKVLILSSYTGQDDVVQALQAGAAGYLPKLAGENELSLAIQTIIGGQTYNLTTDAVDPISKEPEFKACAVNMVPIKMPELDSDPVPVNGTKSRLLPLAAD